MSEKQVFKVLAFAGSLRQGSYNRALLRAAQELAPQGMEITIYDLSFIPFYNHDVEQEGDPEPVKDFKGAIREADAVLIATPEYQHGLPGVLKNALDWASRPPRRSPLKHKPTAMLGASPSQTGTARAQLQLRQSLVYNETYVLMQPEVLVARAQEKFDDEGRLSDEVTRKLIRRLLEGLVKWTELFRGGHS